MYLINKDETEHTGQVGWKLYEWQQLLSKTGSKIKIIQTDKTRSILMISSLYSM